MISKISNRYEILSLIGQGGMADVYRAHDTILNRIVAIKVLRQKLSQDAMTLVRFQREASAASRLSHPNVVDIYDVGESNGMHYIVMEYIRGRTLKELIQKRGALSVKEAIYIMKQLTSAVKCAHDADIIHRDIKPQNVLIKDDGTVKITDFGIAVAGNAVQLTINNAVMGSAHYLAPETAQGKDPNPQVDIYSLGIVFYELLTGDVPFKGKTPTEIALRHLKEPIPYVRLFNPGIPQSVENIVLKASAKNLDDRYHSCDEIIYDLNHCLDDEYRNVKRITFAVQNVAKLNIDDRLINVDFDDEDDEEIEEETKTRINIRSGLIGIGIGFLIILILSLILLVTGIIRFDGFLGYERVPEILGVEENEALDMLEYANFDKDSIKVKYDVSDEYSKGEVIEISEKSGSVVKAKKGLTITVSKGPSFLVEDYTDLYLEDVLADFEAAGVKLDIEIEYHGEKDTNPGLIIEQRNLSVGDRIDPEANEKITFIVSDYPSITIPSSYIGRDVVEVKDELNDMGIAVVMKPGVVNPIQNRIIQITPEVGTKYTQEGTDSVVTLYYN